MKYSFQYEVLGLEVKRRLRLGCLLNLLLTLCLYGFFLVSELKQFVFALSFWLTLGLTLLSWAAAGVLLVLSNRSQSFLYQLRLLLVFSLSPILIVIASLVLDYRVNPLVTAFVAACFAAGNAFYWARVVQNNDLVNRNSNAYRGFGEWDSTRSIYFKGEGEEKTQYLLYRWGAVLMSPLAVLLGGDRLTAGILVNYLVLFFLISAFVRYAAFQRFWAEREKSSGKKMVVVR